MGQVVLVHGAWVHATAWEAVAEDLRGRGHRVEAVELHRGTLDADTRAVQSVVDGLGGTVTVCGWSYGGMVITGLHLPAGSRLVYLTAFMPDEGETAADLAQRFPESDLQAILSVDDSGNTVLAGSDEVMAAALWADLPAGRASRLRASLSGQPLVSFATPPASIAWRETPSTYVVCLEDRAIRPELQRFMARRADHVVEWHSSHSPMLSRPEVVADLLAGMASSGAAIPGV